MKIHFIGIGGIGVSALAQYYLAKGHTVSGSDLAASEITDFMQQKGVGVIIGNSADNIKQDFDLVVYSPAVKETNPELAKAKELGIKAQSYPEALGDLTKEYYTIAVAGAHGKSTTTTMIALALTRAGCDPTVIVGTRVKEFSAQGGPASGGGSNFRAGKSKFLVIEACEYDSSFLHYQPHIVVLTNIDKEHLDYFKTFANVKKAFKDFIVRLPNDGFLVFDKDDKYAPKLGKTKFKAVGISLKQKDSAKVRKILKVPGKHNVAHGLAVLAVAKILNIPEKIVLESLAEFRGTWRRFEILKEGKLTVISDYGHHPNEIMATLQAACEKYPKKRILCVFQPHQHQRTYYLFNDFVKVFRSAPVDSIILTDIYDVAGRETKKINQEVSSEELANKINRKNVIYCATNDLENFVKEKVKDTDVLIVMGAGDIYHLVEKF